MVERVDAQRPRLRPVSLDALIHRLGETLIRGQEALERRQGELAASLLQGRDGAPLPPLRVDLGGGETIALSLADVIDRRGHLLAEMFVESACSLLKLKMVDGSRVGVQLASAGDRERSHDRTLKVHLWGRECDVDAPSSRLQIEHEVSLDDVVLRRGPLPQRLRQGSAKPRSPRRAPGGEGGPVYLLSLDDMATLRSGRIDDDPRARAEPGRARG